MSVSLSTLKDICVMLWAWKLRFQGTRFDRQVGIDISRRVRWEIQITSFTTNQVEESAELLGGK